MPKHRWRDSIKSFFGSHIDPDKDEELKGTRAEIEDKIQKALKLIKDDGERDRKEPLADLIEDFRKYYDSLYARYNHLTGELREKIRGKQGNEASSSTSSDSDSDHTPTSKGSKNERLGNDFEKMIDDVKQGLEAANLEVAHLKRKLAVAFEEKEASDLEYRGALDKIQAAEKIIKDLNVESDEQKAEKIKLLAENGELKKSLETARQLEAELNQKLADVNSEKANLILEREAAVSRIEEENKIAEDLRSQTSQLRDEKEARLIELKTAKEKLSMVEEKLNASELQVAELSHIKMAAEEENNSLSLKILQLSDDLCKAEAKIQDLVTESSQLREQLDEKDKEVLAHATHKNEVSVHIRGLEMELDSLHMQRKLFEDKKEGELSDLLQKLEEKEKDSSSQVEDLTAKIKSMQVEIDSLLIQKSELEEQLSRRSNEASTQIKDLMDEVREKQDNADSLSNEKVELERQLAQKAEEISGLLVQIDTLQDDIANKSADLQRTLEENEGFVLQFKNLELELDSLHMQRKLFEDQKEGELSDLLWKLEEKEKDSSSQLEDMTAKIKSMQVEIDSLLIQKSELEEQLSRQSVEASTQIKDLMDQVREKQDNVDSLSNEKVELERQLAQKAREISGFLVQIDALQEEIANKSADLQIALEEKEGFLLQFKNLELQVNSIRNQNDELEEQLRSRNEEISMLNGQKEQSQIKIAEMEALIIEKESEVFSLKRKTEDGESEAAAQITAFTSEVNNLQEQLKSLSALKIESDALLEEKMGEIVKYVEQVKSLEEEQVSKIMDGQRLLEEKESLLVRVNDLELVAEKLRAHKTELEGHVSSKVKESNHFIDENERLQSRIQELENVLAKRGDELFAIQKKLEDANAEASIQIDSLTQQIENLRKEKDSIHSVKSQLELQLERGLKESSASLMEAENHKSELANRIADQERKLKEQEDAFNKLNAEYKWLEILFQECKENLKFTETKMEEVEEEFQKNFEAKNQIINELEETIEDLNRDMEMKGDEVNTLVENVRTLEVKLRLANQKLRITEQLQNANEENQRSKEEKFQNEQRLLEERIAALSASVTAHKETQLKITRGVPEKVNEIMTGMDTFNMKFEEDYGHLESRVYEILNELKVTMNWIRDSNGEKKQLRKEITNIVQQLKEEKEKVGSMERSLEEKSSLEGTLKGLQEMLAHLKNEVKEKDARMGELQQKIKNRDDGILELGEEKREAIRQLCLWVEYHRSRYDDLREMMITKTNATPAARRQIST